MSDKSARFTGLSRHVDWYAPIPLVKPGDLTGASPDQNGAPVHPFRRFAPLDDDLDLADSQKFHTALNTTHELIPPNPKALLRT